MGWQRPGEDPLNGQCQPGLRGFRWRSKVLSRDAHFPPCFPCEPCVKPSPCLLPEALHLAPPTLRSSPPASSRHRRSIMSRAVRKAGCLAPHYRPSPSRGWRCWGGRRHLSQGIPVWGLEGDQLEGAGTPAKGLEGRGSKPDPPTALLRLFLPSSCPSGKEPRPHRTCGRIGSATTAPPSPLPRRPLPPSPAGQGGSPTPLGTHRLASPPHLQQQAGSAGSRERSPGSGRGEGPGGVRQSPARLGPPRLGRKDPSSPLSCLHVPRGPGSRCPGAPQRRPCHQLSTDATEGRIPSRKGGGRASLLHLGEPPVRDRPARRRENGSASRRRGQSGGTGGRLNPGLDSHAGRGSLPAPRKNFAAGVGPSEKWEGP